MSKVILRVRKKKAESGLVSYVVRNGRKKFAEVYPPNKWHKGWNVYFAGLGQIDFRSKEEALAYVCRNAEAKLELWEIEGEVEWEEAV